MPIEDAGAIGVWAKPGFLFGRFSTGPRAKMESPSTTAPRAKLTDRLIGRVEGWHQLPSNLHPTDYLFLISTWPFAVCGEDLRKVHVIPRQF